jgi:SAM-dependent methyltransferase
MSQQRTTEWTEAARQDDSYYAKQFDSPYRSTIAFSDWLQELGCLGPSATLRVADVGCGMGETLDYMARRFPSCQFEGLDVNDDLVRRGGEILIQRKITNAKLTQADLYRLGSTHRGCFDGIVSLQTLSWLPDFRAPLEQMCAADPEWIGLTALFYDGPVDARIEIANYARPLPSAPCTRAFYNIYSLPLVQQFLDPLGYECEYRPFDIDIDLAPPADRAMGSYTVRIESGRRLQISGPILMSWYFVLARKKR